MTEANRFAERPEAVGVDSHRLEALFREVAAQVERGEVPSVQVAVARDGRIAGMRTFGRVRRNDCEEAATNDTLYAVFSCTKAVTSAAIWLLLQDGKLETDELVATIVPEFASNGKEAVSIEQLLTHTAGFPSARFDVSD